MALKRDTASSVYLDIETTGISPCYSDLTVIGMHFERDDECRTVQLVGDEISPSKLIELMQEVDIIYTYNGARFDLPFIREKLGVNLKDYCIHRDLMYDCWKENLYGGLKAVEIKLGIQRGLTGIDGRIAIILWNRYRFYGDERSLKTLLEYNREDVLNLRVLRQKLNV